MKEQVKKGLSAAVEAASAQGRFWEMHELLFRRQSELEDPELRQYAAELDLDVSRFDADRVGDAVLARIRRGREQEEATRQLWRDISMGRKPVEEYTAEQKGRRKKRG